TLDHTHLHSFPTRRSSDLVKPAGGVRGLAIRYRRSALGVGASLLTERCQYGAVTLRAPRLNGGKDGVDPCRSGARRMGLGRGVLDRKSTRLNSSHDQISYA